jgi:hypothetical protein
LPKTSKPKNDFGIEDYMDMMDDGYDPDKRQKMMNQFLILMKMYGWISDNANIISIVIIAQ